MGFPDRRQDSQSSSGSEQDSLCMCFPGSRQHSQSISGSRQDSLCMCFPGRRQDSLSVFQVAGRTVKVSWVADRAAYVFYRSQAGQSQYVSRVGAGQPKCFTGHRQDCQSISGSRQEGL